MAKHATPGKDRGLLVAVIAVAAGAVASSVITIGFLVGWWG